MPSQSLYDEIRAYTRSAQFGADVRLKSIARHAPATSFPDNPILGDDFVYTADATNGVQWRFVYTGPGTYPWAFVGGPPLYAEVTTAEGRSVNTYADLATVGPSITVPLPGDYDVRHGTQMQVATAALTDGYMSYAIGATAAADADAVYFAAQNQFETGAPARARRKTFALGGTALVAKYRAPSSVQMNFSNRWLSVTPIRVGAS